MKRHITLLAMVALLGTGLAGSELHAVSYNVESASVDETANLSLHTDASFSASPKEATRELDLAPYYRGTVDGFQGHEFFTQSGNIVYNADGTLAKDAKRSDLPVPIELALAGQDVTYGTKIPQEYNYESFDGAPESGGEWWLKMWFMRQPAAGGIPASPDYSNYYYGAAAFLIAVIAWRVRRVRQMEMEDYLESLNERTQGQYFQSTRGEESEAEKSLLRMASDDDAGPYNTLIGLSPLKRITYQG